MTPLYARGVGESPPPARPSRSCFDQGLGGPRLRLFFGAPSVPLLLLPWQFLGAKQSRMGARSGPFTIVRSALERLSRPQKCDESSLLVLDAPVVLPRFFYSLGPGTRIPRREEDDDPRPTTTEARDRKPDVQTRSSFDSPDSPTTFLFYVGKSTTDWSQYTGSGFPAGWTRTFAASREQIASSRGRLSV